jgi:hypothetical protein
VKPERLMSNTRNIYTAQAKLDAAREAVQAAVVDLSVSDETVLTLRQAQRLAQGIVREAERKAEKGPFSFLKFW